MKKREVFRFVDEMVENLISCLLEYKVKCEYGNIDFNADKISQYKCIRVEMTKLYTVNWMHSIYIPTQEKAFLSIRVRSCIFSWSLHLRNNFTFPRCLPCAQKLYFLDLLKNISRYKKEHSYKYQRNIVSKFKIFLRRNQLLYICWTA